VLLFITVNITYLFMYKDQTWFAEGVYVSLYIYVIHSFRHYCLFYIQKNSSTGLAWGCWILIVISSANLGSVPAEGEMTP
jgi:hypothetical protein